MDRAIELGAAAALAPRRRLAAIAGRPLLSGALLLGPLLVFLGIFFVTPLATIVWLSLDGASLSLGHYRDFFASAFYLRTLALTMGQALVVTLGCVILAYPLAYAVIRFGGRFASLILLVVAMSFWTSFLVRTYSWMILLGYHGPVNQLLRLLGVDPPPKLLFTGFSATLAMIHILLPFMVMALYAVMSKIDQNLLRAAASLGARPGAGFRIVFLPLSAPGIVNGASMVFILCLGFYVTPVLLGSPRQQMLAGLIGSELEQLTDWGEAGAMAVVLFLTTLVLFAIYNRLVGLDRLWG